MKTRTLIRFAIPCTCFAAAWIVTHSLRPAPVTSAPGLPAMPVKETKRQAVRPSEAPRKIAAALQSAASGNWQAVWVEFAAGATTAELTAVAAGEPGMAQNLAWEELAARRPEMVPALARLSTAAPVLVAAAAAVLAERHPGSALQLAAQTGDEVVHHAVLATMAWADPGAARRSAAKLPPLVDSGSHDEPASACIAAAWTRRDPHAAAASGLADVHTWARTDAASALRHLLSQPAETSEVPSLWMVAAALRQSPAEAVRIIEDHPSLREVCEEATNISYGASMLTHWYSVAPESCLAAVEVAAAKTPAMKPGLLHIIAAISPQAAAALAKKFPDFDLEDWQQRRSLLEPDPALDFDPAAAADSLLAALEQHPPAEAMTAAGLNAYQAAKLGSLLAAQLPDKARALAAKVSLEAFATEPAAFPYVAKSVMDQLWPPAPSEATAAEDAGANSFSTTAMLTSDPARYAATADPAANNGWAACNAVTNWAPHDYAAAAAWVRALPEGQPRQRAEAALARELAVQNPPAGLAAMAALPESMWAEIGLEAGAGAWLNALHHVVLSGGDWQQWQAKTPAPLREKVKILANDALETDAALLTVLRGIK